MSILSGYKKFKKYIKTSSGFQLQSLWTSANTVEADDKRTIQTKVGAINGISSSETANSAEIAASTALTNKMNGTINNLSRDLDVRNYKDLGTGGTESMTLKDAILHICAHHVPIQTSGRGRFGCAEGWFDYDIIHSTDDYCSGIINGHTVSVTYSFNKMGAGAPLILKKLGSGTVSISNYIFNFNVSTSGNGSSSGNQGRSGKSEFVFDTKNYDVLTIGSYTIEGDGAHAAWNPRDCVALSVTINGIKTAVGEGGRTFDVKNADSATIVATFGTNGNPDYGTWATITVSNITLG